MDKFTEIQKMLAGLTPAQLEEIRNVILYAAGDKPEIDAMERSLKLLGLAAKLADKGIESERIEKDGVTAMLKIKGGR